MPDEKDSVLVNPVQFGEMLGMMNSLLREFRELKTDIKDNYPTRHELNDVKERVTTLEKAPTRRRATVIAVFACVFAGCSGIASVVALALK